MLMHEVFIIYIAVVCVSLYLRVFSYLARLKISFPNWIAFYYLQIKRWNQKYDWNDEIWSDLLLYSFLFWLIYRYVSNQRSLDFILKVKFYKLFLLLYLQINLFIALPCKWISPFFVFSGLILDLKS